MSWWRTVDSVAVYDVMSAALRGVAVSHPVRRRAFGASPRVWKLALRIEKCGPTLARAVSAIPWMREVPEWIESLLRAATTEAVRSALQVPSQLSMIAELAATREIPLMVIKGAARVLSGERAGERAIGDIDLLVPAARAMEMHDLLREAVGFLELSRGAEHHLPRLHGAGYLPVEVDTQLSHVDSPLNSSIWQNARTIRLERGIVMIPSVTNFFLHTLEHAVIVHGAFRYRLRDMLDLASAWSEEIDKEAVRSHVRRSRFRHAMERLLSAAREFGSQFPVSGSGGYKTARRVALCRLAVAATVAPLRLAGRSSSASSRLFGNSASEV